MLRSMTGFASKDIGISPNQCTKTTLVVSLKSLNARFFEATCKLPYQLNHLEVDIIRVLQKKLQRGHIYFTIYPTSQDLFKGTVTPSLAVVDDYIAAIKAIQERYELHDTITTAQILQLPNIFTLDDKGLDDDTKQRIFDTTNDLIDEVIGQQITEGKVLAADIAQRINTMESDIGNIEKNSANLIDMQKTKIVKALQDIAADGTTPTLDMQKNAAYALLDKMDINEEIVRFKSHLKNLHAELGSETKEKGKRLDFTLQELGREINTIAAKCSDATIGNLAINIKVELEKAREQAQNIV